MEPSSCWQPPLVRVTGILTKDAAFPVPFQCVHNYRRAAGFHSGRGYDAGEGMIREQQRGGGRSPTGGLHLAETVPGLYTEQC